MSDTARFCPPLHQEPKSIPDSRTRLDPILVPQERDATVVLCIVGGKQAQSILTLLYGAVLRSWARTQFGLVPLVRGTVLKLFALELFKYPFIPRGHYLEEDLQLEGSRVWFLAASLGTPALLLPTSGFLYTAPAGSDLAGQNCFLRSK